MGDAVRIGHQRKAGHLQRICAVCRSGAQYLRPREAQRRQRSADGRGERGFHRARLQGDEAVQPTMRSEEHTSELQSLMRISYAVFCLKKKTTNLHIMLSLLFSY